MYFSTAQESDDIHHYRVAPGTPMKVQQILLLILYTGYGVAPGTPIGVEHISSVTLYTDFRYLCREFSSAFRKLQTYESLY